MKYRQQAAPRMAGNPVLGFLSARPTGNGAHATVARMLRLMGILVLVGAAVSIVNAILTMALGTGYIDTGVAAANAASVLISLLIGLAIMAVLCWWITFTLTAWTNHDPRAANHVLVLAILGTVFGILGVLGGLAGGFLVGSALYGSGISLLATVVGILQLLVSAGYAYCGILILTNRTRATAGTGTMRGGATG
jgi:hypothetical protein